MYKLADVKEEQELRDVTSHMCAQTTHVELPPPKMITCGWVPDVVNHIKFRQNWLRGFGSPGCRNLPNMRHKTQSTELNPNSIHTYMTCVKSSFPKLNATSFQKSLSKLTPMVASAVAFRL